MVELTKASSKGQIVIPQELREELGIEPGDSLQIERVDDMIVLKKISLNSLKETLRERKR